MPVWLPVQCPHCHSTEVVKNGKSAEGKQRYRCQNLECPYRTFILNPTYPGRTRQVKQQIVEMTLTCLWHSGYCPCTTLPFYASSNGGNPSGDYDPASLPVQAPHLCYRGVLYSPAP